MFHDFFGGGLIMIQATRGLLIIIWTQNFCELD